MYEALRNPELKLAIRNLLSGKSLSYKINAQDRSVDYFVDGRPVSKGNIELLKASGVVKELVGESFIACPYDGSTELRVTLYCPVHNKPVVKSELYEDMTTGQLLNRDEAKGRKGITRLYWFRCSEGELVNSPKIVLMCQNGHRFELGDAISVQVKEYVIDEKARIAVEDYDLFINSLAKAFGEIGYSSSAPAIVKGASGASYSLDMLLNGGTETIGVLVMEFSDVSLQNVIAQLPQLYDLSLSLSRLLLVIVPRLPQEILQAFEKGNITVISGDNLGTVTKDALNKVLPSAKQSPA